MASRSSRLFFVVFRFLPPKELVMNVSRVSKKFHSFVDNNELWAEFIIETYGVEDGLPNIIESRMAEFRWRTLTQSLVYVKVEEKTSRLSITRVPSLKETSQEIEDLYMHGSVCWMWTGELMITGGCEGRTFLPTVYRVRMSPFRYSQCASLIQARVDHGLIVQYPYVYAFGGYHGSVLSRCEKWDSRVDEWKTLPDMMIPRRCFTPTYLKQNVYMAGGSDMSIERFHLPTETFHKLPISLDTPYTSVMSIGYQNKLLFLNYDQIKEYRISDDGTELRLEKSGRIEVKDWYSTTGTVFVDRKAFFLLKAHNQVNHVDLENLTVAIRDSSQAVQKNRNR